MSEVVKNMFGEEVAFTELDINMGYKDKILSGVNYIADMVKVTLGAKGKTVLFNDRSGKPRITKDGVTVCREVYSDDAIEDMAIQIVREAAERTVKTSGDGTTTTTILAQYLVNQGYHLMINKGVSYYKIATILDQMRDDVINYVKSKSMPIDEHNNFDKLLHIATVSSNSNEIGEFIYDILKEIGVYGAIEIKKSNNTKDRIEKVKGIRFNKGFYAPHFVNDLVKMQWRATGVSIVLFDDTIRTMNDIMPYIKAVQEQNGADAPIMFLVNDVEPTILNNIINNKMMSPNTFNVMIVEHDGFGDRKTEIMNDIAAMTGATVANNETIGDVGFAEEVYVDENYTSILGGNFNEELVDNLAMITKQKLENDELDDNDRLYYKRRLATLLGGVAIIHVGGVTEIEMNEKKDRIEDAVEAVRASIERGVSIGGGYTFLNCFNSFLTHDVNLSYSYYHQLLISITEPFKVLCNNADINYKSAIEVIMHGEQGLDVINGDFIDIQDYKIYDPTGVLIDSISNAVSVAKSILSIERTTYKR